MLIDPTYRPHREAVIRLIEAASVRQKWRELDPIMAKGKKGVALAFKTQGKAFVREFSQFRPNFSESARLREGLILEDLWTALWWDIARRLSNMMAAPILEMGEAGLTLGAGNAVASLGIDLAFTLRNPRAEAYLAEHGASLVTRINRETESQLRTLLGQAAEEGWSYTRTAREINERFEGFAGLKPQAHIQDRATLVAVTEAGQAYEQGSLIVVRDLQDAGIRMHKKWLTLGDDRVSDGCAANEAEGWIPLEAAFSSGDQSPLRFPGCRCTAVYERMPD